MYSQEEPHTGARPTEAPSPWYVVNSDVKKHARLNCISHVLGLIPYEDLTPEPLKLAPRPPQRDYIRPPMEQQKMVPEIFPK